MKDDRPASDSGLAIAWRIVRRMFGLCEHKPGPWHDVHGDERLMMNCVRYRRCSRCGLLLERDNGSE